jgi:multiple sugar transport system substrate-binding protein
MKRTSTILAILMVVSLIVAACGAAPTATPVPPTATTAKPAAAPTTPPAPAATATTAKPAGTAVDNVTISAPVEVVFWHVSTQTQQDALNKLIDEFNAANPNIKVRPESIPNSYTGIRQKILAAITAGTTPDLAVAYQNTVAEYANAGKIVALDDYINSAKYGLTAADLADIFPAFLASDKYPSQGGKILSWPPNRSLEVMYYNIDLIKAAGFDGNPPATWDDFAKMCKAASKANAKGYAISISASTFASWVFTRGGEVISADGKTALINQKPGVDALTFLKDLVDNGCAYQIAAAYADQTDFANGQAMFTFGSSAGLPYYAAAIIDKATNKPKFNWSIAMMPNTGKPVVDMYGPSWTVFKSTPEKQLAAWQFLKWFTQADQTARWSIATGYFPVRKSAADSTTIKDQFTKDPNYKKAFDFLQYAKGEPTVAGWDPVRSAIQDAETAVVTGKAAPQAALDDAAKKAAEALNQ